jgi:hypothetical protein
VNLFVKILIFIVGAVCILLSVGCSSFTSINRDSNGQYIITGWQAPGPTGFVWICDYDPETKTLTIKDEK